MGEIPSSEVQSLLDTPELPELGPGPRAEVRPEAELNRAVDGLVGARKLPQGRKQLVRALILLWHDHLDAAHTIAQEIEDADGAFVHGIMHRREPDYGNAAYWFRRVGKHPAFPEIAKRASALLGAKSEHEFLQKVIPRGEWDAFAFIDACQKASSSSDQKKRILREAQEVETRTLLDWFCR